MSVDRVNVARGDEPDPNAAPRSGNPHDGRNARNRCQGKTVIRWEFDCEDDRGKHRRGDPILDEDNARQYRPCNGWGANGTEYCAAHGGSAPQTIAAAKRALALSAEDVARMLMRIATDETVAAETRVKAGAQVLDRIGIRLGVDLSLEVPKWQKLIGEMFAAPREESDEEPGVDADADEEPVVRDETPARQKAKPPKASAKPPTKPKFEGW